MRALRITLIVVVVIGGLFVAADRVAVYIAESKAADKIKSSQGLTSTPNVSIKDFPFLTQVARKDLGEVDVDVDGVTTNAGSGETVRVTKLHAVLHDVHISNNFSSATADRATGSAHISYQDLSAAAGSGITVGYAGKDGAGQNEVKLSGSVLGFTLTATSTIAIVNGDTIRLHAETIPGGNLPGWEEQVRRRTDVDRKINGLPNGLHLEKIEVTPSGIDVSVTGTNVALTS
jgi:LmeA-like phospholipid-binding